MSNNEAKLQEVMGNLEALRLLQKPDWDLEGADAINPRSIERAKRLVKQISATPSLTRHLPDVAPDPNGMVCLTWVTPNETVKVIVPSEGSMKVICGGAEARKACLAESDDIFVAYMDECFLNSRPIGSALKSFCRKDRHYIRLAQAVAEGSKCHRAKYGAIVVSADDRFVGSGRNGKPRATVLDDTCFREGLAPGAPGLRCCLHAEANAILFTDPQARLGGTLYVSGPPCADCCLLVMQSGVRRLVYLREEGGGHSDAGGVETAFVRHGCTAVEVVEYEEAAWVAAFGEANGA